MSFNELLKTRTNTLGWRLGYSFALLDRLVVNDVRATGHSRFGGALATLTKAMPPSGNASIVELAERAGVTKQAMSQLIAKMEGLSYVIVSPDPRDARMRRVSYSPKGEGLARAILESALRYETLCREELGARGFAALGQALTRVTSVLEQEISRQSRGEGTSPHTVED